MPGALREMLKQGFKDRVGWWVEDLWRSNETITNTLLRQPRSRFVYTKKLKQELFGACKQAVLNLELEVNLNQVVKDFIEYGFFEEYFEEQERIRNIRRRKK
jgi:hypothetical protein